MTFDKWGMTVKVTYGELSLPERAPAVPKDLPQAGPPLVLAQLASEEQEIPDIGVDWAKMHSHSWFVTCRRDQFGLTVMDCACGARKRVRQGIGGEEEVQPPVSNSPVGDVVFDVSRV